LEEMGPLLEKGEATKIISAASKHGYDFAESDWAEYIKRAESLSAKSIAAEKLDESELETVAGGIPQYRSSECWFTGSGGSEHRDGAWRKRCTTTCTVIGFGGGWDFTDFGSHTCKCHGTNTCKANWHIDSHCNIAKNN